MLNSGLIGWMPTSLLYDPSGGKGWDGSYPTIMAIYKLYGILHDYGKYINIINYYQYYIWSVVSNMNFIFHNIWDVILPIDVHIFQRGRLNHQPAYYYPSLIIIITILTIINSILPTNGRYTTNQFLSSSHLWRLRIGAPGQESWLPVETPQAGLLQAAQRTMAA